MTVTINPVLPSDATLDKMRRKAKIQTRIFDIIDQVPLLERIEILEEILEALDELVPAGEGGAHE